MADCIENDIFIVGGGPAGLAAGVYAARAGLNVTLAEMSALGGQIALSEAVENYPGFKHIGGYELGETLREHALEAGCSLIYDEVTKVSRSVDGVFTVSVGDGCRRAPALVYAAGASPKRAGFDGETAFTGHGVSYCATCDGMFYRGKDVYVVGGGTAACEEAQFLAHIARSVTMVVRRHELRTVPPVRAAIEAAGNIEVLYNSIIDRVSGDGAVSAVSVRDLASGSVTDRTYGEGAVGVFVLAGHNPRVDLVAPLVNVVDGAIETDAQMRTKTSGLFAAGDVRNTVLRQVITAASDGAVAAMSAYHYLDRRE